jgi:hypothetical protein
MLDGSESDVSMRSEPPSEHDFTWGVNVPAATSNTPQADSKLFGEETAKSAPQRRSFSVAYQVIAKAVS